jgi:hypothetical protein
VKRLLNEIIGKGLSREETRKARRDGNVEKAKVTSYVFRYCPEGEGFRVEIKFDKEKVEVQDEEIVRALRQALHSIKAT